MAVMPMFPLGGVLLPGAVLPLHVFEPRYRALVRHCLAAEVPEFGVVLIERGSEVGGGDLRRDIGTVARLVQVAPSPDGRFALVAVGTRRIRVRRWLPDDPFPQAEVDDWPDAPADLAAVAGQVAALAPRVRRAAALAVELGDRGPNPDLDLADDAALAGHQLVAIAPLGAADRYDLLAAPDPAARMARLAALLDDVEAVLAFRLGAD